MTLGDAGSAGRGGQPTPRLIHYRHCCTRTVHNSLREDMTCQCSVIKCQCLNVVMEWACRSARSSAELIFNFTAAIGE